MQVPVGSFLCALEIEFKNGMNTLSATKTNVALNRLGDISVASFLSRYWQQRPLLVRQAFPCGSGFAPLSNTEILKLATYDEAESRLISRNGKAWQLAHGPFASTQLRELKKAATGPLPTGDRWTILIQDIQHFSHEAHALLSRFAFLPYARIDDLMVSYAVKGGGVGAHIDSYDVFLLQGSGKRRWQISTQSDHTMVAGAPLKLLKNFKVEEEWVLEEGDMLYLPPHVAHNGIAETDDCVTWSVGFRAPSYQELAEAYLDHLRDSIEIEGRYGDAKRKRADEAGYLDPALRKGLSQPMRARLAAELAPGAVEEFIGCYLTAPKSHVEFLPPTSPKTLARFSAEAVKKGIELDLRSRMLFDDANFFVNGQILQASTTLSAKHRAALRHLANTRVLSAADIDTGLASTLYPLWNSGEIALKE
jgi:50S ribosomal protein L16 3-hydroxylase